VSNGPLRHLFAGLVTRLQKGVYGGAQSGLSAFAMSYLRDSRAGDPGFDSAATAAGLTVEGTPLTIERVRTDVATAP
jgi:peptide methionine sulfoxide reductase MsrB